MMKPERHIWDEDSTHRAVAGKEYDEVWDYAEQLEAENEAMGELLSPLVDVELERDKLKEENEALRKAKEVVKEQATDEGLWFLVATAPEGYLQQELRRIHAVIEGDALLTGEDDE